MGLTYDTLERALVALSDGGDHGVDRLTLDKVRRMVDASAHKRALPPMFIYFVSGKLFIKGITEGALKG